MPEKKKGSPLAGLLLIAVAIVIIGAVFASCDSHGSSGAAPGPSSQPSATRSAVESAVRSNSDLLDATYIETLDKDGVPYASKDAVIGLAHMICDDLDSGTSATDVAGKLASANGNLSAGKSLTAQQLGEMMGAGVQAYCPAHVAELGH